MCKMADRGQITGALLDGPLALDNAISPEAAAIKKIKSPVAGRANVLVVPDLEAGNMLAKSLSFLADADAAGIVLGAKVPIILTSRADDEMARLASCAVAQLLVAARRVDAVGSDPVGPPWLQPQADPDRSQSADRRHRQRAVHRLRLRRGIPRRRRRSRDYLAQRKGATVRRALGCRSSARTIVGAAQRRDARRAGSAVRD